MSHFSKCMEGKYLYLKCKKYKSYSDLPENIPAHEYDKLSLQEKNYYDSKTHEITVLDMVIKYHKKNSVDSDIVHK
jgi:hypothetical protein